MLKTDDPVAAQVKAHNEMAPSYRVSMIKKVIGGYEAKKIIDVGCGLGFTTNELSMQFPEAEVLGIDISKDAIEYARKKFTACRFSQGVRVFYELYPSVDVTPRGDELCFSEYIIANSVHSSLCPEGNYSVHADRFRHSDDDGLELAADRKLTAASEIHSRPYEAKYVRNARASESYAAGSAGAQRTA